MPGLARRRTLLGSSSFLPTQISGMEFWFNGDTPALPDGTSMSTWGDTSGNSRNATQATGSKQPIYKIGIINGKSIARFTAASSMSMSAAAITSVAQPQLHFVVGSITATGTLQDLMDGGPSGSGDIQLTRPENGSGMCQGYAGGVLNGPASSTGFHVYVILFNGASSKIWKDGGASTNGSIGTNALTGCTLGASGNLAQFLNGDIRQAGIYSNNPSLALINQLGQYLATDAGLTFTTYS